jgi:hypothetical protein
MIDYLILNYLMIDYLILNYLMIDYLMIVIEIIIYVLNYYDCYDYFDLFMWLKIVSILLY